ncbi:MAG: UbiA family prenyltransferase [bacterium]|nr:MAG: UbiA family prenyltransferase [bacterium]
MKILPEKGYPARIRTYFKEMFPIPARLIGSALLYLSFSLFLARIHGVEMRIWSPGNLIGWLSLFMIMLILRLMDEIKDRETDNRLCAHRPLPSGRVQEADILFTLKGSVVLYTAVSALSPGTFWAAMVVLAYTFGMYKHFFMPRLLKRNLLLTLATHNPIVPIMFAYLVLLFAAQHGMGPEEIATVQVFTLVMMYWAMFFAWEISRKIRPAHEENDYVTYSRILGPFGAVLLASGAQTVTLAASLILFTAVPMPVVYLLIVWAGYFMAMSGHILFLAGPDTRISRLEPFAERYILAVNAALIISHALKM